MLSMGRLEELYGRAREFHDAGLLAAAERGYKELMCIIPAEKAFVGLLGTVLAQSGRDIEAASYLRRTIVLDPSLCPAYSNLGNALRSLGLYTDAVNLLKASLIIEPSFQDGYRNLGICENEINEFDSSLRTLSRAVYLDPFQIEVRGVLAFIYDNNQHLEKALEQYEIIICIQPEDRFGYAERALLLDKLGGLERGLDCGRRWILISPESALAYLNQGYFLRRLNFPERAFQSIESAVIRDPASWRSFLEEGHILHERQDYSASERKLLRSLVLSPDNELVHVALGKLFLDTGRSSLAMNAFRRSIIWKPESFSLYLELGNLFSDERRFESALALYSYASNLSPENYVAFFNKGNALFDLGLISDAILAFDEALLRRGEASDCHINRGNSLREMGRVTDAIGSFRNSIIVDPGVAGGYVNYAQANLDAGDRSTALDNLNYAILLYPDLALANWNKAILLISLGMYREGFSLYHWRFSVPGTSAKKLGSNSPEYSGENLDRRSILIYAEQGFGDTIQFVRLVKMLSHYDCKIHLAVQPELVSIFKNLVSGVHLISLSDNLPEHDFVCPLLNLPHILRVDVDNIPWTGPYVKAHQDDVLKFHELIERNSIGVVWAGNPDHKNDKNRSIPLHAFSRLFSSGARFVALQKGLSQVDKKSITQFSNVVVAEHLIEDFSDTAAIVDSLDLVITVDTSVAHLAGAMGKETWVLLPFVPDYRWMFDREDTPWYPNTKLYRQNDLYAWEPVIDRLINDLSMRLHKLDRLA